MIASFFLLGFAPQAVAQPFDSDQNRFSSQAAGYPAQSQGLYGQYRSGQYQSGQYQPGQYQSGQYQADPDQQGRSGQFGQYQSAQYNQYGGGIVSLRAQRPELQSGLVLTVDLDTSIDTNKTEEGDYVQAHIAQNVSAGGVGYLPGGSKFSGLVAKAPEEGHFGRSSKYTINFTQIRTPSGTLIPIKAHLLGRIGTYIYREQGSVGGRLANSAWRNGVGSGMGRGLGSMMSVGSGSGFGPGSGAYAGMFMAGASQVLDGIFLRHGHRDVFLHPGTQMQLQLDSPVELPGLNNYGRPQYLPGSGPNTGVF